MARLAGSTNLDPELIKFIYARVLLLQQISKISRETLATALKYEIEAEAEENVNWRVPSHENLIKMISEARNHAPNHLDEPWSIAASLEHRIPPEANRDLFDIWRVSLAIDRPLSIRQARWIVYLRDVRPEDLPQNTYPQKVRRSLELISQSWLYSIRERVSEIMGEEHFDTTALDAASFMPPWERATALKLGKVSHVNYSQEALARIEKNGTSLTSPPTSVLSVEEAVWRGVMAEPFPGEEMAAFFTAPDDVLPEEDDLVAAYWLKYLSKGPLWNDLPLTLEAQRRLERRRQQREKGVFVPDSGESGSPCSLQLAVRRKLLDWVKAHHSMNIRDYYSLGKTPHPSLVLSPKLLSAVGYEVPPEDIESYAKLHEEELKAQHEGFNQLPADIQQRFIHDNETDEDLEALEEADNQSKIKQEHLEQEYIDMVHEKGGPLNTRAFWESISDEWNEKHPESVSNNIPYTWHDYEREYKRIIRERNQNVK